MNNESFGGERPDKNWDEGETPGGPSSGEGISPGGEEAPGEGFHPTDLSKLFGVSFQVSQGADEPAWLAEREAERENVTPKKLYEKEVKVMAVFEQQTAINGARAFFVQLRDNQGRELKVYVGLPEATSISMATEGIHFRRPLTHDLTKTIIERLGWKIERITIDDLYNETFYAKLTLTHDHEQIDIDCRPSDAIALAIRAHVPIYVAEEVLSVATRDDPTMEGDSSE